MIKNIAVCTIDELYFFAEKRKIAFLNEIIDLIYSDEQRGPHRHWYRDTFVITKNFFNPRYQEDAYGRYWHPKVRKLVKDFMKYHKLDKFVVCTTKNQSLMVL